MNAGADAQAAFKAQDVFRCPELDVRMKKYLVRLANETANHLIRDTLEPNMHRDDDDDKAREDDGVLANNGDDDDDGQPDARAAATNGLLWKKLSVIKGIQILRGYDVMLAAEHAKDGACCLRGLSEVNASIEEFAMLFKLDSNRKFAEHGLLFNPDLLDMATLYALVQPSGDHPRRYVGIKWCLVQSPSKLFRNRDFCYLECQKEFRDAKGRRGWVRSMHSIKMPCCPSLEKSHSIVRASMYRCGLTAVESDKPGVLNVTYTIEMDLKGHFPELFQPSFISQRIATLASIDKFLQQQRLSSSPLLGDLDLPAALSNHKNNCHLCYRGFSTFTRRAVCRKCGQGVCKSCSGDWELDIPVIGKKKVRICTVCSAEARYSHVVPLSARAKASVSLPLEAPQSPPPAGVVRRDRRSLSFNSPSDFHHLHHQYRDNGQQQQSHHHHYDPQQLQHQGRRVRAQSHKARPSSRHSSYRHHNHHHHHEFQSEPSEAAYEQYRPTYENRETTSDPFLDEYTVDGMGNHHNVRATTDLMGMWDPREEGFLPAAMPSPASYFGAQRLSSATPTSGPPPQRHSQKIGPIRDSILFQQTLQPEFGEPPRDSYSEHQRRQSDFNRFQERRHTTTYGPLSNNQQQPYQQQQRQEQPFPYFGYQDQQQQQQQQLRRRQQSYPFAAEPFQQHQQHQPQQNIRQTDIYPQQRHRQQSESEMHFPSSHVNGSNRNFALEFFHEQYRNSNKPRSNSTASLSSNQSYRQQQQQHQQHRVPSPGFVLFGRRPSQKNNNANRYFETIYSEPRSQHEHQQHQQRQQHQPQYLPDPIPAPLSSPDQTQTAGEVVEYVETPDGEWVEQRLTINFPQGQGYQRSYSGEDDEVDKQEEEEEVLNPGFCIYCGSKRVIHHGVIESTCTCELGGRRDLENRKNGGNIPLNIRGSTNTNSMFQLEGKLIQSGATATTTAMHDGSSSAAASEKTIQVAVDVDQVIPLLIERLSQQSLHAYPMQTQSSYSE